MSKIEVDAIEPQSGTSLTLGASGDTITIPSGATLSSTDPLVFPAGTVSLPAITTTGDTNTGIFFPSADTIAFTEGGGEAMRITSAGAMLLGTTTAGSASAGDLVVNGGVFLGGTAAANELDDYEEGTWTPVFADASSGGNSFTMQTVKGEYLKIGNYVKLLFYGRTNGSTTGITTSNQLFIQGLPFTVNTVNGSVVPVYASTLATVQSTLGTIFARALTTTSYMRIEKQYGDATSPYSVQSLLISQWEGGSGASIEGIITYKV
jgi:hypothetical protein